MFMTRYLLLEISANKKHINNDYANVIKFRYEFDIEFDTIQKGQKLVSQKNREKINPYWTK